MFSIVVILVFSYIILKILMSKNTREISINDNPINNNPIDNTENPQNVKVIYQGDCYDITNYLKKHPGGKKILLDHNGKDVESKMKEHNHGKGAYELLKSFPKC
jgi:cytochrome b involved in lipid metabolism